MKINVVGRHLTVRDSMKDLIIKKLSKLDKYFTDEGDATVTLKKKRNVEIIEVTINAAGTLFRCEMENETFQNALDDAIDAIERQIRKNKTRLTKRLRSGVFEEAIPAAAEETEDPEDIIRIKTFRMKPMSVEEAILQMNLLDHQFFVFVDDTSGDTCVVYSRKDGAYGLIIPEKD